MLNTKLTTGCLSFVVGQSRLIMEVRGRFDKYKVILYKPYWIIFLYMLQQMMLTAVKVRLLILINDTFQNNIY